MQAQATSSARAPLPTIRELLLPFFLSLALYASTVSRNLSASHDSIAYINAIDARVDLFHPHHLLYNVSAAIWLDLWRALGVRADSAVIVSLLNSVFGALTLCVFYLLLRARLRLNISASLLATALPAFSFGLWFYSDCVEVYVIPLFFLLLSLYLLTGDRLDSRRCAAVGLTTGLAVLFHQAHLLFLPVVLLALLIRRRQVPSPWRPGAAYALVFLPLVVLPYTLVMIVVLHLRTSAQAWYWLTLYAHQSDLWQRLALSTLVKALIGAAHAIIGFHFVWAIPVAKAWLERVLAGHWLMDDAFVTHSLSARTALALLALSLLLGVILVWLFASRLRNLRLLWREPHGLVPLTLAWLAIYSAFFFFWEPSNLEFWIPQSVCCWLLFIALVTAGEQSRTRTLLALSVPAALLFLVNLLGSIIFLVTPQNDYYYHKVEPLAALAGPRDLIIIDREWILEGYVRRFTGARVLSLTAAYGEAGNPQAYVQRVRQAIDRTLAQEGRVFILQEAVQFDPITLQRYGQQIAAVSQLWRIYQSRWQPARAGDTAFYLLAPTGRVFRITTRSSPG